MKIRTLAEMRLSKKLTQEKLAKLVEVTPEYISKLETGFRNPSDKLKGKLASVLGVDAVEIFLATSQTKRFKRKEN